MSDSSICAVPSILTANSQVAASSSSSDSPVSTTRPVMPSPTRVRKTSAVVTLGCGQVALEGDRHELLVVAEEDAAVVVVDQLAQLVGDRHADHADVVGAVQLARRATGASSGTRSSGCRRCGCAAAAAARSRSRRRGRPGSCRVPSRSSSRPRRRRRARAGSRPESGLRRSRSRRRSCRPGRPRPARAVPPAGSRARAHALLARRDDHRELLAADPADDVGRADGRAQVVGELDQHLVADGVAEDVVHLLEVVDVEHHERDVLVLARGQRQLTAEALVEVAVVVEAGERVGLGLALEPVADVRVVERERGGVADAPGELELLVAERGVLADPVDVERALERAARDRAGRRSAPPARAACRARSARAGRGAPGSRARARGARPPSR